MRNEESVSECDDEDSRHHACLIDSHHRCHHRLRQHQQSVQRQFRQQRPVSQTDLTVGSGRVAANGNRVTAHYTLWLYSPTAPENKGSQIQTSVGGSPFTFTLGASQVIKGWDQGIVGMAVGGKRRLILPPSLAYGSQGSPPSIPANATLVFDIELVAVSD